VACAACFGSAARSIWPWVVGGSRSRWTKTAATLCSGSRERRWQHSTTWATTTPRPGSPRTMRRTARQTTGRHGPGHAATGLRSPAAEKTTRSSPRTTGSGSTRHPAPMPPTCRCWTYSRITSRRDVAASRSATRPGGRPAVGMHFDGWVRNSGAGFADPRRESGPTKRGPGRRFQVRLEGGGSGFGGREGSGFFASRGHVRSGTASAEGAHAACRATTAVPATFSMTRDLRW
jgi:hypothetical protein